VDAAPDLSFAFDTTFSEAPDFRFYQLYDEICREDVLKHAYGPSRASVLYS
jgi:hypothetical protein